MSELILNQSCYRHDDREAVVRCPGCGHFFCRECATEHDDRMLCSACLAMTSGADAASEKFRFGRLALAMQGLSGFAMLWLLFFLLGRILLAIPHEFHEGTIWQLSGWGAP